MRRILPTAMAAFCLAASAQAQQPPPPKVAVFDLELIDTSLGAGPAGDADLKRRLDISTAELRRLFSESGQAQVVDLTPRAEEIRKKAPLRNCNGCEDDIARGLGADLEVVSIIQKTSNLILSFAVTVKDLRTDKVVRTGQVDIRGDTDENWLRGVRWLVKNRLLATPLTEPL